MTRTQSLVLRDAAARRARRAFRYRGMLVLVIWQVPVQPVVRPNGTIGFMIGSSSDSMIVTGTSCDGTTSTGHSRNEETVIALKGDYDVNDRLRVDVVGGNLDESGSFVAAQLRADWRMIGLGGGIAVVPQQRKRMEDPPEPTAARPSAYLRIGPDEGAHLRADAYPASVFVPQQKLRAGLGYNAVRRDRFALFVGIADLGTWGVTGIAGDVSVPLGSRFALQGQAHYGEISSVPVSGMSVGGQVVLGSPSAQR